MKSTKLLVLLLAGVVPAGAQPAPQKSTSLAAYHFMGGTQLVANTNAAKLVQVAALPTFAPLRDLASQRVATLLSEYWQPANPAAAISLIHPLMQDWWASESLGEVRTNASGLEWALAVNVGEQRSGEWQTNFARFFASSGQLCPLEGSRGWTIDAKTNQITFRRSGSWIVLGASASPSNSLAGDWLGRLQKEGRPVAALQTNWFSGLLDVPRLEPLVPLLKSSQLKPGRYEFNLAHRGGFMRTTLVATYPGALGVHYENWVPPTNLVHDPLLSFLAVRDLGVVLKPQPWMKALHLEPLTNQVFSWTMLVPPFQFHVATYMSRPLDYLQSISTELPKLVNPKLASRSGGAIRWETNRFIWEGMGIARPTIGASPSNDYVVASLTPPVRSKTPMPPELLDQFVGRTNVLYYHWEDSGKHLNHWGVYSLLLPIFPRPVAVQPKPGPGALPPINQHPALVLAMNKDLEKILSETITEASATKPNEITLLRKSDLGLSSLEMLWLLRWIAGTNTQPAALPRPHQRAAGAPAGPAKPSVP